MSWLTMNWSWLLVIVTSFVASQHSLSGGSEIRRGSLVYQILKVLEVIKWQSKRLKFWKPKDGPYEERVKFWCKESLAGGQ